MMVSKRLKQDIIKQLKTRSPASPPLLLALDGPAAAGKSTLADALAQELGLVVIPMDAFFLQTQQRSAARLKEIGGFIDYERFIKDILKPLSKGKKTELWAYDCKDEQLRFQRPLSPLSPAFLIEGVYALHPLFKSYTSRRYLLTLDADLQIARLRQRESPIMFQRFVHEFLPRERAYFERLPIADSADLILPSAKIL